MNSSDRNSSDKMCSCTSWPNTDPGSCPVNSFLNAYTSTILTERKFIFKGAVHPLHLPEILLHSIYKWGTVWTVVLLLESGRNCAVASPPRHHGVDVCVQQSFLHPINSSMPPFFFSPSDLDSRLLALQLFPRRCFSLTKLFLTSRGACRSTEWNTGSDPHLGRSVDRNLKQNFLTYSTCYFQSSSGNINLMPFYRSCLINCDMWYFVY